MTLERGTLLNNRYRIVEILGQGGMAAVYRAVDENLGVEVAVKENLFTTEEYARQFRREAVILANLRHPNLPRVTDHFEIEQQGQYLVMDYIEGEDLRQRIDRIGPLPDQEIIVMGSAICDALTYLHTRNPQVLHRDIKPGNVKITPHGQIFLVDFGLAKVVQGLQLTTTGARAMTPGYSPPEQYGTARTDHRSDIYSLGATLYSALTDTLPEDGLARAMEQATLTPVQKRNPKVTRKLSSAVEKALAVRPEDRFQTTAELKNALLNSRHPTQRRSSIPLSLTPPPVEPEHSIQAVDSRPAAADEENAGSAVDDGFLALPLSTPIYEDYGETESPRLQSKITGLRIFIVLLFLLPLGLSFYLFGSGLTLPAVPWMSGGANSLTPSPTQQEPIMVGLATSTLRASFTPSNSSRISSTPTQRATATTSLVAVATQEPTSTATYTPSPTPLGGGTGQIAFASYRSGIAEIWLMDVNSDNLYQITNLAEGACQPSWNPDGSRFVFISPCRRIQETYQGSSLFIIDADGSNLTPLPSVPGGDYDPDWSPDGKRIVFTSLRQGGFPQIFVINLEDLTTIHLGEDPPRANYFPAWSPDGKWIVYADSGFQIRVMAADGTDRHLITRNVSNFKHTDPVWSPDGQAIIFTQRSASLRSPPLLVAITYTREGSMPISVPGSEMMTEADYSPDGYWIAYTSWPDGENYDIYIMTPNGVSRRQLTTDPAYDFDPAWRP